MNSATNASSSTTTNPSAARLYPVLDAWRGIACLWVIVYHILIFYNPPLNGVLTILDRLGRLGFLGVDIFFVLSGFLISGVLLPELNSGLRWRRFYGRRFFKIIPQYGVVLVLTLILYCALTQAAFAALATATNATCFGATTTPLTYAVFLQNYSVEVPPLGHAWTLAVEEQFYIGYPLLLLAVVAITPHVVRWRRRPTSIKAVLLVTLIALLLGFNMIRLLFLQPLGSGFIEATAPKYFQETHFRVDALIFGCILQIVRPQLDRLLHSQRWAKALPIGVAISAFGLLAGFTIAGFDPFLGINYTLAYLVAGALIITTYNGTNSLARGLLMIPGLRWVGKRSYAIYLWHYPLVYLFGVAGLPALLFLGVSLLVGALSTATIERFFLRLRDRMVP